MVPGAVPIFLAPGQKVPVGEIIGGMVIVPAPRSTCGTEADHACGGHDSDHDSGQDVPGTSERPSRPTTATKPATTGKSPTVTNVQEAMRNFAAFQRYANWRKTHPGQATGTASAGSHP